MQASTINANTTAGDISGNTPTMIIKTWFTIGCAFLLFMGWTIIQWVTAPDFGRTLPPPGTENPTQFLIGHWVVAIGMGLVWLYYIITQIILPWKRNGAPNTLGLLTIGFFFAIFWDPSMNWIQQGCVYNVHNPNLGFLSYLIPGWLSPRSELLAEPLLAWAGGYPGFLLWMVLTGLAFMRFLKSRFPGISNVALMISGVVGAMLFDAICEILLIRLTGIYAYPGSIRALCLFSGHWYQFPIYEMIFFGGWVGVTAVLVYFKDDKGLTWVERGVEQLNICKRSNTMKALVRAVAIIGFCQVVEVIVYVLPMPLITANADPFPADTPACFLTEARMIGPETGLAIPRPDLPIIRRNDKDKFSYTIQITNEQAMSRVANGYEDQNPLLLTQQQDSEASTSQ